MKDAKKYVWEFTNQRKLTKKEFISYLERKVFKTIRKFDMLPEDRTIRLKKTNNLNTNVLKEILEQKFKVIFKKDANFSDENASDISEVTLKNILKGKFSGPEPKDKTSRPLYFLTDKELDLYARLKGIKGKKKSRDKQIERLTEKFTEKNQDLEQNILKALKQINETVKK